MLCSNIQNNQEHTKINECIKNIFLMGFYNIFILFSIQLQMIAWNYLLMVILKHICYQNCYYRCLFEIFIISLWSHQKRIYWRIQGIQTVISSLVIWSYITFFQPNWIIFLNVIKLCVVVSITWLPKVLFVFIVVTGYLSLKINDQIYNAKNIRSG